jgi:hypothetical protein
MNTEKNYHLGQCERNVNEAVLLVQHRKNKLEDAILSLRWHELQLHDAKEWHAE